MPLRFLSVNEVVELHKDLIARYGGLDGIRDQGLLDSAVAMPRQSFGNQLLHPTLVEMAAAYMFHLVSNHAFNDGNKRVGAAAALVFLKLNGQQPTLDHSELERIVLGVAAGSIGKSEIVKFLAGA